VVSLENSVCPARPWREKVLEILMKDEILPYSSTGAMDRKSWLVVGVDRNRAHKPELQGKGVRKCMSFSAFACPSGLSIQPIRPSRPDAPGQKDCRAGAIAATPVRVNQIIQVKNTNHAAQTFNVRLPFF
jgi:hypothetical protein